MGAIACTPAKKTTASSNKGNVPSMQLRLNIVNFAEEHLGTKYKYAGQKPSTGFDCSGFTSYVMGHYGIKLSPASSEQAKQGRELPIEKVNPGDLVFFAEGDRINHVALVVKRDKEGIICIHSTTSKGVMMDNISKSTYWKPRIRFAREVVK